MTAQAFWQLLYEHHADLVLNGHDHLYARYRPLDPSGNYDPKRGIREFIVGTGGETLDTVVTVPHLRRRHRRDIQRSESRGGNRELLGCDGPDAR